MRRLGRLSIVAIFVAGVVAAWPILCADAVIVQLPDAVNTFGHHTDPNVPAHSHAGHGESTVCCDSEQLAPNPNTSSPPAIVLGGIAAILPNITILGPDVSIRAPWQDFTPTAFSPPVVFVRSPRAPPRA